MAIIPARDGDEPQSSRSVQSHSLTHGVVWTPLWHTQILGSIRLWRQVSLAVWLGPDMEPQMPTPTGRIKKVLGSSWPLSGCADGFRDTSQSGEGSLHCVWRDHAQRDATSSLSLLGVWAGLLFVSAIKQMALQIRSDFRFSGDQVGPGTSDAVHPREVPARSLVGA